AKILLERRKKVYKPQMEWLEGEYTKIPQSVQEHLKEKGLDALSKSEAEPFRVILDEIEEGCPEDGYSLEHFTSIIRAYIISDPDRGISPDLDIHIDKSPYLYQGKAKVTAFPTGGSQITLYDIRYGINTRHNDKANFLLRQISIVHELAHIALHGNVERGNIVETPVEHFQAVLFAQLALHKLHEKRIKSGLSPNNEAVITQRVEDAKTAINYAIFKYFNEDIKKQPELDKFLKQLLNPHMP
ncbi:MAG: hypothetical protein FWB74_10695, partial [Defluviitaleaceae bacterium]|nr:hypothetical protein [Defluviitaleaceae bacterium]